VGEGARGEHGANRDCGCGKRLDVVHNIVSFDEVMDCLL
jgi:hypothetical protein